MGFSFNNDAPPPSPDPPAAAPAPPGDSAGASPVSESPPSAALVRFRSCRWMQPVENGSAEFCTHQEVKPYAGMTTFDADAWCPDCPHYKMRRTPKKRSPADDMY